MKIRLLHAILASFLFLSLPGCGDDSSTPPPVTQPVPQPVTATLKLASQGTLEAGSSVGGLDLVLTLPDGVTVATGAAGDVQTGVVVPSGVATGSLVVAKFTPATATGKATLRMAMISTSGFLTGEFATVNCDIAAGNFPKATDFGAAFSKDATAHDMVVDASGMPISGLMPVFTADIK